MEKEKREVKDKVQNIIKTVIKPGMSDVEKELALHDYLIKNADYNMENYKAGIVTAEDHNAYGVLINKKGVCESYAKAMNELLTAAGIECKYVTGKVNGGEHAWNMVKIDNEWYNLDVTWDDPISDKNPSGSSFSIISVNYKYFNVADSIFNKDHIRGSLESSYPACTSTKYSFDNLNVDEYTSDGKLFIKVKDMNQVNDEILKALSNRQDNLCLKVKDLNIKSAKRFMMRIQAIAMKNKISGFSMNGKMYDSYIKVEFNWK
nr:transglutaminase domain-containing protein [Clostridium botulinum]